MCNFFSFLSDGNGKVYFLNTKQRTALKKSNPNNYQPDSHSSIANYYGLSGRQEDTLNKWEYDPLTKELTLDFRGTTNDKTKCNAWLAGLDFKTIVPELVIKPIINPFSLPVVALREKDKQLLKQWDSVWDSVRDTLWDSVGDTVWDSVGDTVRNTVWDSVGDTVRNTVGDTVWDSVGDSVRAYVSSFFTLTTWKYVKHTPGQNPFQPCISLWERGLVPSFDGKTWRLHTGKKAKIVYEWTLKK